MCDLLAIDADTNFREALAAPGAKIDLAPFAEDEWTTQGRPFSAPPYSYVFNVTVSDGYAPLGSALLSVDLLRRGSQWSGAQVVSRLIEDHLRLSSTDHRLETNGCRFVGQIIQQLFDPHYAEKRQRFNDAKGAETIKAMAAFEEACRVPALESVRAQFCDVNFTSVLQKCPAEFHVYMTRTLSHERFDCRGSTKPVFRIVSREGAPHRMLHQFTLGEQVVRQDSREVALWFERRLHRLFRPKSKPDEKQLRLWVSHAWQELAGATPRQSAIETLASGERPTHLVVVFGRETATLLGAGGLRIAFDRIENIAALNTYVGISFRNDDNGPVCRLEIGCKDVDVARNLLTRLGARAIVRVGRSKQYETISYFDGSPSTSAVHVGFPAERAEALLGQFLAAAKVGRERVMRWDGRGRVDFVVKS